MKNVLVVKNTGISEEGTIPRKRRACYSPVMSASRSTTRPTMLESGTTSLSQPPRTPRHKPWQRTGITVEKRRKNG